VRDRAEAFGRGRARPRPPARTRGGIARREAADAASPAATRLLRGATVEAFLREPVAAELPDAAAREAEELGFGLDGLWTGLDLGTALAETDPGRAKEVLTRVAQTAGERSAVTVREPASRRLGALGVRTWRRGSGGGVLTGREQVIAHLIAGARATRRSPSGCSSRKTVERHVSNVLRKAGVRDRAELAARVAELEVGGVHR
jgi:hypothetical protein